MENNSLLLADLHLTAHARDEYRWRLFPWLKQTVVAKQVRDLFILGDLTEAKDYHSSKLVNRVVDELIGVKDQSGSLRVWILPGNHDAVDMDCPYFRFLGRFDFIRYMATPFMVAGPVFERQVLFLPHTKDFSAWETSYLIDAEVIFMHQTIAGAKSETGHELEGISSKLLAAARRATIWSGDVHVPQKIGPIEYVGSPYPVRFGDSFKPRAVLLTDKMRKAVDLETPRFGRWHFKLTPAKQDAMSVVGAAQPGDQVKFTVRLTRSEFVKWEELKRSITEACQAAKVELCGVEVEHLKEESVKKLVRRGEKPAANTTPMQTLEGWCTRQKVEPPLAQAGREILASVIKGAI